MPAPRYAAKIIWAHIGHQLNSDYRAAGDNANRGWLFELLPPVFVASTIYGCRTLLKNAAGIQRLIVAEFRRGAPSGAGDTQFEEFAQRAEMSVVKSAERYDRTREVKFLTYAHKGVRGAFKDWLTSHKKMENPETPAPNADGEPHSMRDLIPSGDEFYGSYAPNGQKSVLPVPSDDWAAEWLVGDNLGSRPRSLLALARAAKLNQREWIILCNIATEERPWKDMAAAWGMSPAHLSVMKTRTLKKLKKWGSC
jgi:RNA polymerase sigma factor (sigma-70 family)